ncbi:hypothetical protein F441_07527 [Phytophthora nicotianae CJ01A1]|uniref:SWIM-type domain-containing protein n=2 Tax=Phytophthora nicotianae TaxID=4792 RepID=W2X645_PHYNI|nr:hypothetical protein F441_07527 [Phytophthora nicotianae CJ01A1]
MSGAAWYNFHETIPGFIAITNKSGCDEALDEPRAEYSVNKKNWVCSCLFMSARLLPCRHVFYIRKVLCMEAVIPTLFLPLRWLLSSLRAEVHIDDIPGKAFSVGLVLDDKDKPWNTNRKFREAKYVASEITETMAGMGMRQYRTALDVLKEVARRFKRGESEETARQIISTVLPPMAAPEDVYGDGFESTIRTTLGVPLEVPLETRRLEDELMVSEHNVADVEASLLEENLVTTTLHELQQHETG